MMKIIFVSLLVIFSHGSVLAASIQNAVVKVISHSPKHSRPSEGSGFLFTKDNQTYAITSEHVLLVDGSNEVQYEILLDHQNRLNAELLSLDWGTGLALLKIKETLDSSDLPNFEQLKTSRDVRINEAVTTLGYPVGNQGSLNENAGRVKSMTNQMNLFIETPDLIEIQDADTEFGMSGGIVVHQSNAILGLLTYRRQNENLTYAIPWTKCLSWLEEMFQKNFKVKVTRLPHGNGCLQNELTLGTGNYLLCRNRTKIKVIYFSAFTFTSRIFESELFNPSRLRPYIAADEAPFFPIFDVQIVDGKVRTILRAGTYPNGRAPRDFVQEVEYQILDRERKIIQTTNFVDFFKAIQNPSYLLQINP